MRTLCFTGHRKIRGAYVSDLVDNPIYPALFQAIKRAAVKGFDMFISGGALGTDQIAAQAVLDLGLYLAIAKPFPSQSSNWPSQSRQMFENLCKKAVQLIDVSPDPYTPGKMQVRNEWMVDRSDVVIAVFDGNSGGTANCVKYARSKGRPILVIDPNTLVERWL